MVGCGRGYKSRLCSLLGKNGTEEPASGVMVAEICVACVFEWAKDNMIEGDQLWMTE